MLVGADKLVGLTIPPFIHKDIDCQSPPSPLNPPTHSQDPYPPTQQDAVLRFPVPKTDPAVARMPVDLYRVVVTERVLGESMVFSVRFRCVYVCWLWTAACLSPHHHVYTYGRWLRTISFLSRDNTSYPHNHQDFTWHAPLIITPTIQFPITNVEAPPNAAAVQVRFGPSFSTSYGM